MNNDELKKKMNDIISNTRIERIADALIAAGIGDAKEYKHRAEVADKWRRMLYTQAERTEEAEHRAEVAERAFNDICLSIAKDIGKDIDIESFARTLYKYYISEAEKELAEERKDD